MITSSTHTPFPERLPVDWRLFQICITIVVASVRDVAAKTPWQLLFFAFGIDVIVDGLQQTGLIRFLASELAFVNQCPLFSPAAGNAACKSTQSLLHGRI
ncbi:hypothetical protein A8990_15241 [Paenibacillus taihuensis]|uniref:Uncharacterized protein n=1 Tax=Paenibacillus taihuensis TaxID=1156355 RepID=A0A3D9Q9A9_9BACL|nr:hypothetical protein [Paenibacillus taihuensis]REE57596.1 hypothetical protein A8990_15241 [Paenibacillus taihuensis]